MSDAPATDARLRTGADRLARVRLVLYEPQDSINIGAVVRVMKNMGIGQLALIRPLHFDENRIEVVAHATRDVVAGIRHCDTLEEAIGDCVDIVAYSGRRRAARWAFETPESAAGRLLDAAAEGPVAILFGREDHGLPAEVIDRAHAIVTIPTTEHMSLNIAQAALVACYELHLAAGDATRRLAPPRKAGGTPTGEQMERLFEDCEQTLEQIAFFRTRNPELVLRALRSVILRARPDTRELEMLRAMAIEVRRTIERERKTAVAEALGAASAAAPDGEHR
ncbi:MAG: TrmJ/YjtD family RNA methyltransferase [Gemmatimonadaceae bacterium]|jgi:tRNA/rRNA methyltransferase/tRNA (cytidine32/uridine32-2'-O)-methyltransferase|nr:TrmJ/YjtD family RNA methyltransferase [Gemmatimonadaceae bacterium]